MKERIDRKEFYEDNHNDAFNREYTPVKYEQITWVKGKPLVLPSERMFRKNQSTLRENELFYDDIDSIDYVPTKYDSDDIPLDRNLWMKPFKSTCKDYAPDTIITTKDICCYDAMRYPWTYKEDEKQLENYKDLVYEELWKNDNINYNTLKEIFKSSSILQKGKTDVNPKLCNLAIELFRNSQVWDETEKAIMDEIRIPIYKKVYGDFSAKKYEFAQKCLNAGYSNEGILDFLKEFYSGYIIDLNSIMTNEEVEQYNKSVEKTI